MALSTLQSLCAIVAAQSSATTETTVLSPSAHPLQFRARSSPVSLETTRLLSDYDRKTPTSVLQLFGAKHCSVLQPGPLDIDLATNGRCCLRDMKFRVWDAYMAGAETWHRILNAIERLQAKAPAEGEATH